MAERERISSDYLEYIIRDWAENLWTLNNPNAPKEGGLQEAIQLRHEFSKKFYGDDPRGERGLSRLQRTSEQSFVLACYGLAYAGALSEKFSEAVSNSRPFDAWRSSVARNSFQQRYNVFESILKETLDKFGPEAAIKQFPDHSPSADSIIATLMHLSYKPQHLDQNTVLDLIRRVAPKGPDAPKAEPASP